MPKRNGPGIELLADPTRRRIIAALALGPRRPSSLAAELHLSRPAVSRQLRLLCDATLVDTTRSLVDGRVVLYRLQPATARADHRVARRDRASVVRSGSPWTRQGTSIRAERSTARGTRDRSACLEPSRRCPQRRTFSAREIDRRSSRSGPRPPQPADVPAATMTLHGPGSYRRWTTKLRERRPCRRRIDGEPPATTPPQPPGASRGASATEARRHRTRRRHRAPRRTGPA